jgi:serpin B
MLVSEYSDYPYRKTDQFEAVVLPAVSADMTIIMPAEGTSLGSLEEALAEDADLVASQLERRIGNVELPEFHFARVYNLRPVLENLGLRSIFWARADLFQTKGSRLLCARQSVSLTVDRRGILADAETSLGGLLLGMMLPEDPFHMKVDRPFLFQIRDNVTGVLLFMGAVTDPSQH